MKIDGHSPPGSGASRRLSGGEAPGATGPGAGADTIRIGHFEFLNGYPLYFGLERGRGWGCFDLVHGVPTKLNGLLLDGRLDISPISSIEYAAHAESLLLFPRVSITADGAVDSIQLLTRVPVAEVGSVALTGQSATSVVLLKILLSQMYGLAPQYIPLTGGPQAALAEHDAVLLIGDQALGALYQGEWEHAYDLGILWKELTGLPMVFALWAVRRPFFEARPDETYDVQDRLMYSVEYCRGHWDEVVAAAAAEYSFPPETLRSYFAKLRYDFTGEYRRGLEEFYRRAVEIGAALVVPPPRFI